MLDKLHRLTDWLFRQRGEIKGDCLAGYALLSMLFVALLVGVAMYV